MLVLKQNTIQNRLGKMHLRLINKLDNNDIHKQEYQSMQQQLPNISRIRGVWGDPDVHDLTPTRTSHVKRSFPTDPQKTFLKRKKKERKKKKLF